MDAEPNQLKQHIKH